MIIKKPDTVKLLKRHEQYLKYMADVKLAEDVPNALAPANVVGVKHAPIAQNAENHDIYFKDSIPEPTKEMKAEAKYNYEFNKTVDQVVEEADQMFDDYKKKTANFRAAHDMPRWSLDLANNNIYMKYCDKLLPYYQNEYKNLFTSYPFILRLMVQLGLYKSNVFRKYLKYLAQNPYKRDDEYFDRNAYYSKMLHRAYYPRMSDKELNNLVDDTRRRFKEEKKEFEDIVKQMNEDYDENQKAVDAARKDDILRLLGISLQNTH